MCQNGLLFACTVLVEVNLFQGWVWSKMCWCRSSFSRICADVSRGQMFIAIIKQPLLWLCVLCPLLLVSALLSFCAGLGGIGAARHLCSSVIRKGGRESASQQDSLFYIHQKSCLLFAPALTCDSMDCSTTPLLRKSCGYHPLLYTVLQPCPITARHCPPTTYTPCSLTRRPMHQLINFSIIIDIAALLKSSDFCQGHSCWGYAPTSSLHLPS